MFQVDNTVPKNLLPKNGTYPMQITKIELGKSSKGNKMVKLELTISPTCEKMVEQGLSSPVKVFDNVVLEQTAIPCKVKENNFIRAFELEGKDGSALGDLIGYTIDGKLRQVSDDYGDRMQVFSYVEKTLKKEDIPF